jgi:hypothetical protein
VVFEFDGQSIVTTGLGVKRKRSFGWSSSVSAFEVWVEIFEAQGK